MEGELLGGRYRLGAEIGAGGMGVVYEAVDETLHNRVAVKVLREQEDSSPESIARLAREARAAAALGHPNIVRVTDMGTTDGGAYLVMELLQGTTLEEELDEHAPLDTKRVVRVHLQLLDALGAAHDAGVLHRDVKPGNTFLTRLADGTELVKLLDFGLAYLVEQKGSAKLTRTGIALGTPAYMSPERLYGEALDPRSDLYAVGVSIFESLTGELPFHGETPMELRGRILLNDAPDLRQQRPEVTEALADVVRRALEKNPRDRFRDAREMAEALAAAIEPVAEQDPTLTIRDLGAPPPREAVTDRSAIESAETLHPASSASQGAAPEPSSAPRAALEASPAPDTLRYGGVTVPPAHQRGVSTVEAPARPPQRAPRRRRSPLLVGLGIGAALGVVVLGGLGVIVLARPAAPRETGAGETGPTQTAPVVSAPEAPEPVAEPEVPVGVETPPAPPAPEVEAPDVAPPEMEPQPRPEASAPRPRPRPPRAPAPQVRPLAPPTPAPALTPAPRPRVDPDQPLVPAGWE